jgi:hypothetical protein
MVRDTAIDALPAGEIAPELGARTEFPFCGAAQAESATHAANATNLLAIAP